MCNDIERQRKLAKISHAGKNSGTLEKKET